ncbi:helix-turn-helix domain-containing protein [Candidatus Enterococcus courvalinii]|uniref:Helix-turn-helix domain-containing protein n=1 Tax=Candidatus Enterococcus courvalinii TaxID=2815329 RepID=A0ABS3HX54_9ENTE|nr:helix-turn-helix domain-containing protein [Enterococcus sp. MSG2901]MBO0480985.1 helix-turn-helix domain-containing protein [Enterococcus sp. MSG2901]
MLISNKTKRELTLLHLIMTSKKTSFDILSKEMKISKRTIGEDITKINSIFHQQFDYKRKIILTNTSGSIKINSPFSDDPISYYYHLKFYLLNESILYQLCILLVTNGEIHQNHLIERLYISTHYLVKLRQQLNKYLSVFDLFLKKENSIYSIEGNEICYRIFTYLLLQDSFQGIKWPFDSYKPNSNLEDEFSKNSLTKDFSIQLFNQILTQRFKYKKFLSINSTNPNFDLFKMIMDNYDGSLLLKNDSFDNLDSSTKESERLYVNFFERIFLSDIIPIKKKVELGRIFESYNHQTCIKSRKTYEKFSRILSASGCTETNYIFLYYINICLILYQTIGNKYFDFLSLLVPTTYLDISEKSIYLNSIKRELDDLYIDKEELNYIVTILCTLCHFHKTSKLKIYIQMTKVFTSVYVIQERLRDIFNQKNIVFTDDYSEADIIITDSFEKKIDKQVLFYLDNISNKKRWYELVKTIQNELLDRLNSELIVPQLPLNKVSK